MTRVTATWWLCLTLLCAAGASVSVGCLDLRDDQPPAPENPCTTCHGSTTNEGNALLQSAPPNDLFGNRDTRYPGVGAHALHLYASSTHGAVACSECHRVPETTDSAGHADSERPAELEFGALASTAGATPQYDAATRRCSDSYCHGAGSPVWTRARAAGEVCGSCHGVPPPAPHPQAGRCSACHGAVVDDDLNFVAPERHVNGVVDVVDGTCSSCHGSELNAAPPRALERDSGTSPVAIGAHQAHLSGGSAGRALGCNECHPSPDRVLQAEHLDGHVDIAFSSVALSHDRDPSWQREDESCSNTWCHSPGQRPRSPHSPDWTSDRALQCNSCHDNPPPAPHPASRACAQCHADVVASDGTIRDRQRHVDGVVNVDVPTRCDGCHGDLTRGGAPPPSLSGSSATTRAGVGAHAAHLNPQGPARPVACAECHQVPSETLAPGHVDSDLPAEVIFSGVALAFNNSPEYENGSCQQSFCHTASIAGRNMAGSKPAPNWTQVDGSARSCTSCHSLPPPGPHPAIADDCSQCHKNIAPDRSFIAPERHIDGIVTFFLTPR